MELEERLAKLYAGELRRLLDPPRNPKVNRKQTVTLMRRVEESGSGVFDAPDERTWIWSDLHLGHTVAITAFDRPFRNTAVMDAALMDAWRERVCDGRVLGPCVRDPRRRDDRVLGDVSAEGYMHVGHKQMWNAAPGRKWLVVGNHEHKHGISRTFTHADARFFAA